QRLTTATAFIRFNGYLHNATDYARADAWIEQLTTWLEQGLQTLYFFVHYEEIIHSPKLVRYILEKLADVSGLLPEGATPIPQPIQGSLFD
ncbi:MAG: DUF72 domain-containing protein, partial [Bacteroidota bacterium]|nr:DUF72 domain-containing protein [Bacteroidota bacterium]